METRNESGLEKPATFNSAHVQKAHVLSGHGNRLYDMVVQLLFVTHSSRMSYQVGLRSELLPRSRSDKQLKRHKGKSASVGKGAGGVVESME